MAFLPTRVRHFSRCLNNALFAQVLLLFISVPACSSPKSKLQLEINGDVPDSMVFRLAASVSERLSFRAPWRENGRLKLSTKNQEYNFQDVLIEIEQSQSGEQTTLDMTFYKSNWKGELKSVPAQQFDFYRQAFQQEMNPAAFKDWQEFAFQKKSPGIAYALSAVLPETLPFYFRNGDFELQDYNVLVPEVLVFLIGDLGATYFLLDEEWMPAQKLVAVGGFAITRLLGAILTNYRLKRNEVLVRSGFKYKK